VLLHYRTDVPSLQAKSEALKYWAKKRKLALRGEQYRVPAITQTLVSDLPDRNTSRTTLGWTYSLYNGVRFVASYGRNFATGENHNIWTVGVTYRFAAF
jgi:hypothetical protein